MTRARIAPAISQCDASARSLTGSVAARCDRERRDAIVNTDVPASRAHPEFPECPVMHSRIPLSKSSRPSLSAVDFIQRPWWIFQEIGAFSDQSVDFLGKTL